MWESPSCPICQSKNNLINLYQDISFWEYPGKYTFKHCTHCGLIFQSPRPPITQIKKYYQGSTYWGIDITKYQPISNFQKLREYHYGNIYHLLSKYTPGRILDVGSGLGLFLSQLLSNGWQVQGTETSLAVAKYAQKIFGVPVAIGVLEKLKLSPGYYDVVTLLGVFEHLYTPRETLIKIHKLLKPGGTVIMTLPNINSISHSLFKHKWYHLEPNRHLYHYSPSTIKKLLTDVGFTNIKIDHWLPTHNYDSLFNSFRFALSPHHQPGIAPITTVAAPAFSLKFFVGKIIAHIYACIFTVLGPLLGKSEMFIVYAKKT